MQGAKDACKRFGPDWSFGRVTNVSLSCVKHPHSLENNCDGCMTYRILVWKDGADDRGPGNFSTFAGKFYGGHSPCTYEDNMPICGDWTMQGI